MIETIVIAHLAATGVSPEETAQLIATPQIASPKLQTVLVRQLNTWLIQLDALPSDFDTLDPQAQTIEANKIFAGTESADKLWCQYLTTTTLAGIQGQIHELAARYKLPAEITIVRAATSVPRSLRQEIRDHFKTNLVLFETDTNLLGGLQIYHQHKLFDYSWQARLTALNALL